MTRSFVARAGLRALIYVALPAQAFLMGCDDDPVAPPPIVIPGDNEPIVYSRHIQPIFSNNCSGSGCHLEQNDVTSLRMRSWEEVMSGAEPFGAVVIPFNSTKSHLFQHVNRDTNVAPVAELHMPLGRDPLPAEQIALLRRWINEGARNDAGEVALSAPERPRVYVTAQSDDMVSVIDLATQRVMRYISVGTLTGGAPEAPHNITLSPDGSVMYVNLIVGGVVEKYDARTFVKLGSVRVGLSPAQVAVTKDGGSLYVSNFDQTLQQHFIMRVDAVTMTVTDTIFDVGDAPHGVTLNADGSRLYTTNALGDNICEIDTHTLEVLRRIPISPDNPLPPGEKMRHQPYQGVFDRTGLFWITCRTSGQVRVLDPALGRVIDSIAVGQTPLIPALSPDGSELWVPNQGAASVSVIDVATRHSVAVIANLERQPHAIAFTADGRTVFVSCENQGGSAHHPTTGSTRAPGMVYVIDVSTRAVKRVIEVGSFAAGIVVAEEHRQADCAIRKPRHTVDIQ